MDAVLEEVRRKSMQGESTEILSGLACQVDTDAGRITIRTNRDLGIRVGDEVESDAFEWTKTVTSVRRERTEEGYRITLGYG